MYSPENILEKYWGFKEFRHPQKEIITSVLSCVDSVALLPTGGGKSICFQIPTLIKSGVCIVVSPLIALMNDQVNNLQDKNIKAIALTSRMSIDEIVTIFDNLQFGNYKFLYISPEKLMSKLIQQKIQQLNVQLIAIDEAHCISEWGHDFRPSYLNIHILRDFHPTAPMIALTASATKEVIVDIIQHLKLRDPEIFKKSFFRKNLAYQIYEVEDKINKVEQILNKVKGSKIIYTNTRRSTVEISAQLNSLGYNTAFYHGGMNYDDKKTNYENWLNDKTTVIVATNAFGMGIDKADVRCVIHVGLPQSIENYMQEAGRGGRNGKKAFSVVLTNKSDIYEGEIRLNKSLPTIDDLKKIYFNLNQFLQISYGELISTKFNFSLTDFCSKYKLPVLKTFNALKLLERENVLIIDDNLSKKPMVKFIVSNHIVYEYCNNNSSKDKLIKLLLRTYGGVFEDAKAINAKYLSTSLKVSKATLKNDLNQLHKNGIIQFNDITNDSKLQFLVPREDSRTINTIAKNAKKRNDQKITKFKDLVNFIENNDTCRSRLLLSYFDEIETNDCGICDYCISKNTKNKKHNSAEVSDIIIQLLKQHKSLSSKELVTEINLSESDVLFCLKILLEKNILGVTSRNKYSLN